MNDVAERTSVPPALQLDYDGSKSPVKTLLFLVLCAAWILPGLIGHEPWKPDEAAHFGLVYHYLQGGDWILPALAGEPVLNRPPLYYLTAALFGKLFSPFMPLHDAARLATGFYMALTFLFVALAGQELYGERHGRLTVLILIGCLGLMIRAHEMIPDVALLAGIAVGCYGFALARRQPWLAGLILGTGAGRGFLARGVAAPGILGSVGLLLLFSREWRNPDYLKCLAAALIAALPWLAVWPLALYLRSPDLLPQWLNANLLGLALDLSNATAYYLSILPWYGWPALPLALWTLWQGGLKGLRRAQIQLPLIAFLVMLGAMSFSRETREVNALPLLIPLSLLAANGVDTLRRGAASALDWFGMMTFGLFCALLWLGWFALLTGEPRAVAAWLAEYLPGFRLEFNGTAFSLALLLTLTWLATVARSRQSNRRAIVNWTAGITMFWMLAMTLWLPLIDEAKSYRAMMLDLQRALPQNYDCVASRNLGESQRALLDYYLGIRTRRLEAVRQADCSLLLIQGSVAQEPPLDVQWRKIWEGSRPGDRVERFRLYQWQP